MSQRGSDGWNPTAGTGYPYSGQPFAYVPPNSSSLISGIQSSGLATIPVSEDTSPANISIYVFISGTVNPYQSSSWYQWNSGIGLVVELRIQKSVVSTHQVILFISHLQMPQSLRFRFLVEI